MKIHVQPDTPPFAVHAARPIPFAWREEVREQLETMVQQGVIELLCDQPSEWCHPLVIVPKSSGSVRICVDMTKLNKRVARATYPLTTPPPPRSGGSHLPVFPVLHHARCYAWLLASTLAEEHQILTTFMTPWGRFKFLRSPMGLVSTGDEFCRRGDVALSDIDHLQKVVDDIIVEDDTFPEHVSRVRTVLNRCREHAITLNAKKFQFAAEQLQYVGFLVACHGIVADPAKVQAIQDFPAPTNRQELRSFMGLANQLADFADEFSSAADPLRALLRTRHMFQW